MIFRITIATLLWGALVSPIAAQQYTEDYSDQLPEDLPEFEEADRNGDSLVDWEEARAAGVPREVFEAEQQQGFVSKPTWDYIFLRKDP